MVENLKIKFEELKGTLTEEQQTLLHFKSIDNFLFHFDTLNTYQSQIAVKRLLEQYFEVLDSEGYDVDKKTSTILGKEFIIQLGRYYGFFSDFKLRFSLSFALFVGIHLDLLLLILGILKKVYYLPLVTLIFLAYWFYVRELYEKRKKVYDIRY